MKRILKICFLFLTIFNVGCSQENESIEGFAERLKYVCYQDSLDLFRTELIPSRETLEKIYDEKQKSSGVSLDSNRMLKHINERLEKHRLLHPNKFKELAWNKIYKENKYWPVNWRNAKFTKFTSDIDTLGDVMVGKAHLFFDYEGKEISIIFNELVLALDGKWKINRGIRVRGLQKYKKRELFTNKIEDPLVVERIKYLDQKISKLSSEVMSLNGNIKYYNSIYLYDDVLCQNYLSALYIQNEYLDSILTVIYEVDTILSPNSLVSQTFSHANWIKDQNKDIKIQLEKFKEDHNSQPFYNFENSTLRSELYVNKNLIASYEEFHIKEHHVELLNYSIQTKELILFIQRNIKVKCSN